MKPITNEELEAIGSRIDNPAFIIIDLKADISEAIDAFRPVFVQMAADRRRLFDIVQVFVDQERVRVAAMSYDEIQAIAGP